MVVRRDLVADHWNVCSVCVLRRWRWVAAPCDAKFKVLCTNLDIIVCDNYIDNLQQR